MDFKAHQRCLEKEKSKWRNIGKSGEYAESPSEKCELRNKLANDFAKKYSSFILSGLAEGKSLNSIAGQMNSLHIKTVKDGRWTAETVKRVATRITIRMT